MSVNYKKVGFINNFDKKGSYPEFGYKEPEVAVKVKAIKPIKKKRTINSELKEAKKKSTWQNGKNPTLLLRAS